MLKIVVIDTNKDVKSKSLRLASSDIFKFHSCDKFVIFFYVYSLSSHLFVHEQSHSTNNKKNT